MRTLCLLLLASIALISAARPLAADAACDNDCWAQWDSCCYNCGGGGTYWCYDNCDQVRDQCLQICSTCPSTRDYTTTTVVNQSLSFPNAGCYWHPNIYPAAARQFDLWTHRYRYDNYRETTACNGSKTTQLLSTSYSAYTYCMRPTFVTCVNPQPFSHAGFPLCPF
jgi:hypothetical protein